MSEKNLIHISPKDYQAYDIENKRILTPQECMSIGLALLPNGAMNKLGFVPLHFTGRTDIEGTPVFEQDVVSIGIDTGFGSIIEHNGVMRWSPEAGQYAITFIAEVPGMHQSKILKRLGSFLTNPELLKKPE